MKQTSVEWVFNQLWDTPKDKFTWYALLKEANEIEKRQTLDFTRNAVRKILDEDRANPFNLEQYYNETFKKD